jgi:signal transduction histidine kinase
VICGAILGYALELRRTHRANLAIGDEAVDALRKLSHEEADARLEIVDLHHRQRRWTQLLEEQLAERAVVMEQMLGEARRVSENRVKTLRGMSHDLNNPLLVLMSSLSLLEMDGADANVTRDMQLAIDQMRQLLRVMVNNLSGEVNVPWAHQELDVAMTTDQLRGRMKALVFGRDIRVSVFRSREAPESIRCDSTLFDRVVDNLFTNAAKYTVSGSIVVEVGGTPGYLTLKVSDTGRGIPADKIAHIFVPGGSDESSRAKGSFGVGLSVVVHLLARIGGRLEVMSRQDIGTTFWAHFPVQPLEGTGGVDWSEGQLDRVLTIRQNTDS